MKRCFVQTAQFAVVILFLSPAGTPPFAASAQQVTEIAESRPPILSPETRGDLAMIHQQYIAAIEDYRQAPVASAVIWNKIGMAYHHLFAMDEARRDYEHALKLRPEYPEALNNLGAVYYAKKNYKKAIKYYRRALHLDPSSAPIYSNMGTAYFAQHKTEKGLDAYRKAFALDPNVFENSVQLVSESLPARARAEQDYCMAELFASSGRLDRALEYLRKALDEGFDDRKKILEDRTLAQLRTTPEFAQLMNEQKLR
jgi:tetratricopeptide (TPR) repeat protein